MINSSKIYRTLNCKIFDQECFLDDLDEELIPYLNAPLKSKSYQANVLTK